MVIMNNYYQNISQKQLYLASSLYDSVEDNDLKSVESLLARTANPNILLPDKGISSFHLVIGNDSASFAKTVTELFLQHGGDPNVRSEDDLTPVHIAAAWGRQDILDLLLKCGGDPTVYDHDNQNALDYAISENYMHAVSVITKFIAAAQSANLIENTPCELLLEKILINNGALVAEYEVSKNRTTDALSQIPFDLSHNADYIREWCQSAGLVNDDQGDDDRPSVSMKSSSPISSNDACKNPIAQQKKQQQPQSDSDYSTSVKTGPSAEPSPLYDSFFAPTVNKTVTKSPQCRVIHLNSSNDFVVSRKKLGDKQNVSAKSTRSSSSFTLDASSLNSFKNGSSSGRSRESGINTLPQTSVDLLDVSDTRIMTACDWKQNGTVSLAAGADTSDSKTTFFTCEDDSATALMTVADLERNVFSVDESYLLLTSDTSSNVVGADKSELVCAGVSPPRKVSVISVDSSLGSLPNSEPTAAIVNRNSKRINNSSAAPSKISIISIPSSIITVSSAVSEDSKVFNLAEEYRYTDKDNGVQLIEKRLLTDKTASETESIRSMQSSKLSTLPSTFEYDTDTLRNELVNIGCEPGPINKFTKRVYLRKLHRIQKNGSPAKIIATSKEIKQVFSHELEKTLNDPNWTEDLTTFKQLEETVSLQFEIADPTRRWREGVSKSSFTYLLLDPRVTDNLPCRAETLTMADTWKSFVSSIFYVGKGKRSRPYAHLYEAVELWNRAKTKSSNKKLQQILDIWSAGTGVVCLHVFQNVIPVEAYTREAAMISALDVANLKNLKRGDFYGAAATWNQKQKRSLGVFLLYRALLIFLNEGERQLRPADIE